VNHHEPVSERRRHDFRKHIEAEEDAADDDGKQRRLKTRDIVKAERNEEAEYVGKSPQG